MSELNLGEIREDTESQTEIRLPAALQEIYMDRTLALVQSVASEEPIDRFTSLPLLSPDCVETVHILTDANYSGVATTKSGKKIVFHEGSYSGEPVQFATRYRETHGSYSPIAWGIRRVEKNIKKSAKRAEQEKLRRSVELALKRMSPTIMDDMVKTTLVSLDALPGTAEPELREAA